MIKDHFFPKEIIFAHFFLKEINKDYFSQKNDVSKYVYKIEEGLFQPLFHNFKVFKIFFCSSGP